MLKRCLVLSVREFQENSLVVSVAHAQLGKQELMAKGGKHIAAKLTPSLSPLNVVNVWLAQGRGQRAIIREVELVANLTPASPLGLKLALKMMSLLDEALQPGIEIEQFFTRMLSLLRRIHPSRITLEELTKVWVQFELVLLGLLGVRPSLDQLKGKDIKEASRFLERHIHQFLSS